MTVLDAKGVQDKTDALYCLLDDAVRTHFLTVKSKMHNRDKPWMTPQIKSLISERQAAFAAGDTTKWHSLRNKVKRNIEKATLVFYADRLRHLQKIDSENWHKQIKVMTRNGNAELGIYIPNVVLQ